MKDWTQWGIKHRLFPEHNYHAVWFNLKTTRLGTGVAKELPPDKAEFYDVGINTLCNAECDFCYVSAGHGGVNYPNICETWKKWMNTFTVKKEGNTIVTDAPFQIAIGSTGEPTIHPDFCKFLQTVYESEVVPNYTTNGLVLSNSLLNEELLEYTRHFVGGVAVSFGNPKIIIKAHRAVGNLLAQGNTNVNIHHIISDKASVDRFYDIVLRYGKSIHYHVVLPLMPSGRSTKGMEPGTFEYLEEKILDNGIKNVAFGAHFVDNLKTSKIKTCLFPPGSLSKNIILTEKLKITPSSFNLKPIKVIEL